MTYANGVVMRHAEFGKGFGVRFIGTKGRIDIARDYFDSDPANIATATLQPGETKLYTSDDHYADWLNACKNGSKPICHAEVGHRSNSVCALANIAYQLRRPLTWNPKKERFKHDKEANSLLLPHYQGDWKL